MKYINKNTLFVSAIGLTLLALPAARATADEKAEPGAMTTRTVHQTAVVTKIDRSNRTVVLQAADGSTRTVDVPQEVKAFDTLKPGDHIDIDYKEGLALSMLPPGSKVGATEKKSMARGAKPGTATSAREVTASAVIVAVDPDANTITFKGPKGDVRTVDVSDPDMQERLKNLKPGQVIQLTYTQAVAASIRPSGK